MRTTRAVAAAVIASGLATTFVCVGLAQSQHAYIVVGLDPLPGGATSTATAINDLGQVAGGSATTLTTNVTHAVVWRTSGCGVNYTPVDLGTLNGKPSSLAT